ncbi:alpha-ketoglutarate-dependent taurine dioxygenase [bacterium BMS3Bbin10]|nr:alpha-ketoglutarate-dependent taurine dioxygenase [bacterium BMS3Bbin10]HDL17076.1 hypothetical protein [Hyphomicrobiales bacterium]
MAISLKKIGKTYVGEIGNLDLSEPPDAETVEALLERLCAHATQPEFIHARRWRPGDIVMRDNRRAMRRATPCGFSKYERTMHRTTIKGAAPQQAAAA